MLIQKSNKILRQASYMSGALLFLLVFFTIFPLYVIPDNTEATTKSPTPSTVTLAFTRTTASATLNVTSLDGSFATSASGEEAAFNVTTNNATGYTLNLRLSDSYNYNTATNSNATQTDMASSGGLLESISSMVTASNFSTSTTYNNKWGILPNKYNSSANTNYYPATTAGFTMDATSAANTTSNNYTVGLGVRANYEVPAGTYNSNYIVATVVANAVTYAINYYDPSGEATGMPATNPQTGTISTGTTSTSVTLASAPTRTGYDFIGWCSGTSAAVSNITTTNGVDTCSSTVYDAGQSFGINATGSSPDTYYLHAMWEVHYTTMQTAVPLNCGDDMKDTRDGNIYSTASIVNLCWMTKNLDLPGGTTLTSTDSNVLSDYTLPASSTTGFSDDDTAYVYNSNSTTCESTGSKAIPSLNPIPCYSYYSFVAASAGTGGTSVSSGNVSQDICPAGWRLPTKTEYEDLTDFYAGETTQGSGGISQLQAKASLSYGPFFGIDAGYYKDDTFTGASLFDRNVLRNWSSTIDTSTDAYAQMNGRQLDSDDVLAYEKSYGYAVRCVMKASSSYTYNYMQDQTSSTLATLMPSTDSYTKLYDKRDGMPYTVAKLADGKYWMLDNLAIDLTSYFAHMDLHTNASYTSIRYLEGEQTRDPSTDPNGNFATAGVSDAWTSSSQDYYSIPMVNMASKDLTGDASDQWGNGSHKYGGYYNYCAATAGSYCYGNGTSAGTSVGNATEDICPAGWRMPTGGASGEYQNLCNAILGSECASSQSMTASATTSLQYKLSLPLSGLFYSGSAYSSGGFFWSSTWYDYSDMHSLRFNSAYVYPQYYSIRNGGYSIRCLATDTYTLTVTFTTGVDSVTIGNNTLTSSDTITLNQDVTYPISMTFDTGYEFDSWSATSGTIGSASTNSTTYTIGSSNATLTAGAKQSYTLMQDATIANCGETMMDSRDSNTYTTATINGLCWMTKNLDLPGGTELTSSNSNVASSYTLPTSSTSGFDSTTTAYVYNSNSTTCASNTPCYSYYSFTAATAGDTTTSSGEVMYDICPKGWRLPTSAEMSTLIGTYTTGATLTATPFLGNYTGYYNNSTFNSGGTTAWYMSSSASSASSVYNMQFDSSSSVIGNSFGNKQVGYAIRCVMVPPYMQDQTSSTLAELMPNSGDSIALADARDKQTYTIAKIGNDYWMTKNLNLAGGTALSADDTNIDSSYISSYTSTNQNLTKDGDTIVLPASSTSFMDDKKAAVNNSGLDTCSSSTGCYSYYSFVAATVGSNPSSGEATVDICPKGWRLPTTAEYTALTTTYSSLSALSDAPFNMVKNGYYNGTRTSQVGSYGSYWTSTAYGKDQAYDMYAGSTITNSYVAKRQGNAVRCIFYANYMQDQTSSSLATLMPNTNDTVTLMDKRDGKKYTVAKLADGKYWMTTNLELAGGTALSADDTDVDASYISSFSTSNNLTKDGDTLVLPASSSTGFKTSNYSFVYNSGSTTCGDQSPCYSYYSWDAATLGSGRSISTNNENAPYSICPKGWHLPTTYSSADSTTDFHALMIAYGGSSSIQTYSTASTPTGATMYSSIGPGTTPDFQLAGLYSYDSFSLGGTNGYYWSATTYTDNYYARYLGIGATSVYSADSSYRYSGRSVRCLFSATVDITREMQEQTSSTLAKLLPNTNSTTTLFDSRDGKPYIVAKLADGKYWMTQNLELAGGTALSADDTDVDASYISSFSTSNNLTKDGDTLVLPASSTTGFDTDNYSYVYNSNKINCGSDSPCYSYYSWDAATIGSGRSISTSNTNAPYSICPKGWHLPTTYYGTDSTTDFRALMIAYGGSDAVYTYNSSTTPTGATMYSAIGPITTPSFQRAGYYDDSSFSGGGTYGYYWSATSYSNTGSARRLRISASYVYSATGDTRSSGYSVRCLFTPST